MKTTLNSLADLQNVSTSNTSMVDRYQEERTKFRSFISRKNKKFIKNADNVNSFDLEKSNEKVYQKIKSNFENEKTRNWMIHVATNFLPLNVPAQCPLLPQQKYNCPLSGLELTDSMRIKTGDRHKAIGYVGLKSNVILSSVAIIELYRYVYEQIIDFESQMGQIINHAFDDLRNS